MLSDAGARVRVSIGMPVYNGGATIEEAVLSLLAQTFTSFELLISDNGSSDETETICRRLATGDDRVRYVRQRENRGGIANFEFVLAETTAPYFMWAAADDVWAPEYLATVVGLLDANPNAVMGFTFVQNFSMPDGDWVVNRTSEFEMADRRQRIRRYILQSDGYGKSNLFYALHRRSMLRHGLTVLHWSPFASDVLFVLDLLLQGPCRVAPKILFFKRYQPVLAVPWGPVVYLRENLKYSLRHVRVARMAGSSSLFQVYVLILAALKYLRDLFIWSGWMLQAVKRRTKRLFIARESL